MRSAADLYAMPRNLVLAASAGTGKTHALVGVVVHLLIGGRAGGAVDPSRIVATTFSRKAARNCAKLLAVITIRPTTCCGWEAITSMSSTSMSTLTTG